MFRVVLLVLAGLFTIVCAAMDFDWFMENSRARLFVRMFGRDGARIFYGILGIVLIGIGGWLHLG